MKKALFPLCGAALFLLSSCSPDASKIDNARFEIEQGNRENARKILLTVGPGSKHRAAADSLLKVLEAR